MMPWIRLLRPNHWLKNLMLFFPPFFGGILFAPSTLIHGIVPLITFCLAASGMYIVNDIADLERDRLHPSKKLRPLPSGAIPKSRAAVAGVFLLLASLICGLLVSPVFLLNLLAYLLLIFSYSLWWKQVAILDIFCVAIGFLLRLEAGGAAFAVHVSDWLFLTVFFLALFLAAGKRLAEKKALNENAPSHRPVLSLYGDGFLEGIMFTTGGTVLVTYAIYVIGRPLLIYTVPLCCLGLFRYLHQIWCGQPGDPIEILLKDPVMSIISACWLLLIGFSLYS